MTNRDRVVLKTDAMLLVFLFFSGLIVYAYLLNKRLSAPHPDAYAYAAKPISDAELAALTYPTSDDMAKAAGAPTGKAYIVIGGSGFVGKYIVRTLLGRGETLVLIVDAAPPDFSGNPKAKDHLSRAGFVKADVADYNSIKAAISRSFGGTGVTAQVIIHTAEVFRPYERLSYVRHLSSEVNVNGTKNILRSAQELGTVRALVFTSNMLAFVPPAKHLRLMRQHGPVFTEDVPDELPLLHSHYADTKREADALVRAADNVKGVRTGVLRPGMSVIGAGDTWSTSYLTNPDLNFVWGGQCLQSIINPWDLARAHVQLADALEDRPDEVGGLGFAVTGQPTACSAEELRQTMQACHHHDLRFQPVSILPLYVLSHFMEIFFITRFYVLVAISKLTGAKVTHVPQWAIATLAVGLQPALWDVICGDYVVDDSQIRKVLGYRNLWSNEQTVKWTIEDFEGREKLESTRKK